MRDSYRIQRYRQFDATDAIDRAIQSGLVGSQRMLVQVYQKTTIPTTVPKYYACHPVLVTGTPGESGTPTYTVDTASTVYVLVIGPGVPVAGTYLVAHEVGGRWAARHSGTTCGTHTITFTGCAAPYTANVGAGMPVVVKKAGTAIASGTTNSSSQFSFAVPASGTDYTVEYGWYTPATVTASLTVNCGNTSRTLNYNPLSGVASTLYITTTAGTVTVVKNILGDYTGDLTGVLSGIDRTDLACPTCDVPIHFTLGCSLGKIYIGYGIWYGYCGGSCNFNCVDAFPHNVAATSVFVDTADTSAFTASGTITSSWNGSLVVGCESLTPPITGAFTVAD